MVAADRLRPHSKERLAAPVQVIDFAETAARLRAEQHGSVSGHRQIAIVRHGPVSLILYAFEKNGVLKQHRTEGVVTMQVLAGRIEISAAGVIHDVKPGEVVALAPEVLHSVRALLVSDMLLTVHRVAADDGAD